MELKLLVSILLNSNRLRIGSILESEPFLPLVQRRLGHKSVAVTITQFMVSLSAEFLAHKEMPTSYLHVRDVGNLVQFRASMFCDLLLQG